MALSKVEGDEMRLERNIGVNLVDTGEIDGRDNTRSKATREMGQGCLEVERKRRILLYSLDTERIIFEED